ncbi:hypothetical protein [Sphingobium abikonense]|uniref:hypothetical protein n=1 Tax=Sphingobium abikonense TaxID=86193 RepID=UPI00078997D2|nr:hypothetical protein [Sphingobium abikonense]
MTAKRADIFGYRRMWAVLPKWVRAYTLFLGLPAWAVFALMIFSGQIFEYETLTMLAFGIFGSAAAIQTFFVAKATWRGEI